MTVQRRQQAAEVEMEEGSKGRSTDHDSRLEVSAEKAERDFVAARQAWYAGRGEAMPPRTWLAALPGDAPESVRDSERRYFDARDAWWRVRDRWLVNWDREPGRGG